MLIWYLHSEEWWSKNFKFLFPIIKLLCCSKSRELYMHHKHCIYNRQQPQIWTECFRRGLLAVHCMMAYTMECVHVVCSELKLHVWSPTIKHKWAKLERPWFVKCLILNSVLVITCLETLYWWGPGPWLRTPCLDPWLPAVSFVSVVISILFLLYIFTFRGS